MSKKLILAWISVFVVWMAGDFLVHGVLLRDAYLQASTLFRPEAEQNTYLPLMLVAHVIMAGAFVWIYSRGVEATPWTAQGFRFGLAVACLTVIPTYLVYYVVQPLPKDLVIRQIVFGSLLVIVLGLVAAFMYRGAPRVSLG